MLTKTFRMLNQFKDARGRIICVGALINGVKVVFCNVYAPNKEDSVFFHEVHNMVEKMDGQIILGGDLNQTIDNHIDRSKDRAGVSSKDRLATKILIEDMGLIDIWRLKHPKERDYTFYSHYHRTYSRIDLFLISGSIVDWVIDCNIGVIAITDHALVELHIDMQVDKCKLGRWRLNISFLQDKQFTERLGKDITSFLEFNRDTTERIATVWDALKAYIRGNCIAYSSWKKKKNTEKVQLLEKKITRLEKHLIDRYDEVEFREICQLKSELHDIYNKKNRILSA